MSNGGVEVTVEFWNNCAAAQIQKYKRNPTKAQINSCLSNFDLKTIEGYAESFFSLQTSYR